MSVIFTINHYTLYTPQEINKMNEGLDRPALLVPSGEELAQMEQASQMAAEVTNTMMSQKLDLEGKKRTVSMLKKALVGILTLRIDWQIEGIMQAALTWLLLCSKTSANYMQQV